MIRAHFRGAGEGGGRREARRRVHSHDTCAESLDEHDNVLSSLTWCLVDFGVPPICITHLDDGARLLVRVADLLERALQDRPASHCTLTQIQQSHVITGPTQIRKARRHDRAWAPLSTDHHVSSAAQKVDC